MHRVRTDKGDIEADVVVNAGGMYAAEIGRLAGVRDPGRSRSPTSTSSPSRSGSATAAHLPTMRDPDLLIYFREEGGGLVMGGYERDSAPWALRDGGRGLDEIPPDFNGRLLEEDWDRFEEIVVNSRKRVPAMEDVKVTKLINGPEAFTPDGEFCLGETAVRGFFVAAGFCAHGLAGAGGVGKVMAEWIVEGEPSLDLWHMDIRRFGEHYRSPRYTLARTREVYETYYDIKYPNHERQAGRPLRTSPAYPWHAAHGAVFGEKSGWERVNWYAANAAAGDESLRPRGWAGMHWSPAIGAEHRACREAAALFDETSFAKLEVSGPGRAGVPRAAVRRTASRARSAGSRTRRCSTAAAGSSATSRSTRLEEDRFGDRHRHGVRQPRPRLDPLAPARRRARPTSGVANVTSQWACFGLWGPNARDVLGAAARPRTSSDDAFPYMTCQDDRRRRRARPRAARHLRRRAGLGALLPDGVRRRAVADAVGGGRGPRPRGRRLPRDRLAAAREGLPRLGRRHHARRAPVPGGPRLRGQARQGRVHRPRGAAARPRGRRARRGCAASCSRTRAPSRSPTSPCGSTGRCSAGSPAAATATPSAASIAYAYLPPEHAAPGTEVAVEIFGEWVGGAWSREPLYDPEGARGAVLGPIAPGNRDPRAQHHGGMTLTHLSQPQIVDAVDVLARA